MKHTDLFSGMKYVIDNTNQKFPILIVENGNNKLEIKSFSSVGRLNGKSFDIGSVVVYIDKNNTFYLPSSLKEIL